MSKVEAGIRELNLGEVHKIDADAPGAVPNTVRARIDGDWKRSPIFCPSDFIKKKIDHGGAEKNRKHFPQRNIRKHKEAA